VMNYNRHIANKRKKLLSKKKALHFAGLFINLF